MADTIRLSAKAAVLHDDAILLVEYRCPGDTGHFSLPGGRVGAGESARDAVVRKVLEETGTRVVEAQFVGVVEYVPQRHEERYGPLHRLHLLFRCAVADPDAAAMPQAPEPGHVGLRWVPLPELPDITLQPDVAEPLRDLLGRTGAPPLLTA